MFQLKNSSNYQVGKFKQKVYCMNLQPPVEVSKLNDALRDFSNEIIPNKHILKAQSHLAQKVKLVAHSV